MKILGWAVSANIGNLEEEIKLDIDKQSFQINIKPEIVLMAMKILDPIAEQIAMKIEAELAERKKTWFGRMAQKLVS